MDKSLAKDRLDEGPLAKKFSMSFIVKGKRGAPLFPVKIRPAAKRS